MRDPFFIGDSLYAVYYKEPLRGKVEKFHGVCENFNASGKSAFWNEENEQMLIIEYSDIVGLYPL